MSLGVEGDHSWHSEEHAGRVGQGKGSCMKRRLCRSHWKRSQCQQSGCRQDASSRLLGREKVRSSKWGLCQLRGCHQGGSSRLSGRGRVTGTTRRVGASLKIHCRYWHPHASRDQLLSRLRGRGSGWPGRGHPLRCICQVKSLGRQNTSCRRSRSGHGVGHYWGLTSRCLRKHGWPGRDRLLGNSHHYNSRHLRWRHHPWPSCFQRGSSLLGDQC